MKKGKKPRKSTAKKKRVSIPPIPAEPTAEQRKVALTLYVEPPPKPKSRREIFVAVCGRIVQGERVHAACKAEGIHWRDLWMWKAEDHELHALYARAREASAESWEDKGTQVIENNDVDAGRARDRENHYRWRAKMANPKQYGDKIDLTSAGARIGLEELVAGSMERKPV